MHPALKESIRSLTVSDDAAWVLATTQSGALYLISKAEAPRQVGSLGLVDAAQFLPGSHTALLLERGSRLLLLEEAASGRVREVADVPEEWKSFGQMAVSLDGGWALLTFEQRLAVVDLRQGGLQFLAWDHPIDRVTAMERSRFVISGGGKGGVWVVDETLDAAYVPANR
jgi:hypothetical protein